MPQCYNPSLIADQDTSAFGKNSRYMKANTFNQHTRRRMEVINSLENRFTRMRLSVLERNVEHKLKNQRQARINILESYKRTLAYQLVIKNHPIRNNPSYKSALNDNYSFHSLRHEIKQMLNNLDPSCVRLKKAKAKVNISKEEYSDVIANNLSKIKTIVPKKPLLPEVVAEDVLSRTPTPPPPPKSFRRSIIGPPPRGLAKMAQGVTLQMVKEKSWMGTGLSSPSKSDLNPHNKLPAIPAAEPVEVEVAA